MERRERISDEQEGLRLALRAWQSEMWTGMPGIVQSFDPIKITVVVKCAISFSQRQQDGTITTASMPELVDVPVITPRGGGCTLTFPIQPGDECFVVFANRCIDGWWQSGGVQQQIEMRMHDLSDGFAIVGPFSQATKIANWNPVATELRSNDDLTVIRLNPETQQIDIQTGSAPALDANRMQSESVPNPTGNINLASATGNIALSGVAINFLSNNGDTLMHLNAATGEIDITTQLGNIIINAVTGNVTIEAGGNITIDATRGGTGNTVTVFGTDIILQAAHTINLLGANVLANGRIILTD